MQAHSKMSREHTARPPTILPFTNLVQPHQPPGSSNDVNVLLPQGLRSCSSLCLNSAPPQSYLALKPHPSSPSVFAQMPSWPPFDPLSPHHALVFVITFLTTRGAICVLFNSPCRCLILDSRLREGCCIAVNSAWCGADTPWIIAEWKSPDPRRAPLRSNPGNLFFPPSEFRSRILSL